MNLLIVGMSHRTAPLAMLERLAREPEGVRKLAMSVVDRTHVAECVVVATCTRIEIYAAVDRFHASVDELTRLLLDETAGEKARGSVYVHYDGGAVRHLFQVAAGLDSMALGESQILGQVRDALRAGHQDGLVGPVLNTTFQQALRIGKRVHAETDLGRAAPSLVAAALDASMSELDQRRIVVVGAGSMASLAVAGVRERGASEVVVVSRSSDPAGRLAERYAVRAAPMDALATELATADLVVACTGSTDPLITADILPDRPLTIVDVAMPRDVAPEVAALPQVTLVDLDSLARQLPAAEEPPGVAEARTIVAEELAAFEIARAQSGVTPTVVALRSMATAVVEAELGRLDRRLPQLNDAARTEIRYAARRIADKLLHQPTVRVKELAGQTDGLVYAAALAELFDLDLAAVEAVMGPEVSR
jgi:glutamyl-tRNA reductase